MHANHWIDQGKAETAWPDLEKSYFSVKDLCVRKSSTSIVNTCHQSTTTQICFWNCYTPHCQQWKHVSTQTYASQAKATQMLCKLMQSLTYRSDHVFISRDTPKDIGVVEQLPGFIVVIFSRKSLQRQSG